MLFRGFSAYPGLFYPRYFSRSTKPAPPSLGLAAETGQHRLSPALCCVLPHPLQNRVPRVQVLLPLPQNRRKHWVFAGFLFSCVAWFWCSFGFGHRVFSPGFIRFQPFSSSPAPKTHPVSPFSGFSGCVFLFFAAFWPQNFRLGFCASCRIAVTNS